VIMLLLISIIRSVGALSKKSDLVLPRSSKKIPVARREGKVRVALQSVRYNCSDPGVTAEARPLLELAARSECSSHRSIAATGLAIPLCRWPLPRLCGFPSAGSAGYCLRQPEESSLRVPPSFRVLPSHTYPFRRSRSGPLMGFRSLQHMKDRGST
jgi:hypothetical protein